MDTQEDAFISLLHQIQNEEEYGEMEQDIVPRDLMNDFNAVATSQPEPERIMIYNVQSSNDEDTFDCPVCWETFNVNKRVTTMCDHHYCSSCIENIIRKNIENNTGTQCAMCRTVCTLLETQDESVFEKLRESVEEIYQGNIQLDHNRQSLINDMNSQINDLLIRRLIYEPYDLSPFAIEVASEILQSMNSNSL
jgi:hypothetical protein